jgi:hypothetical protein
VSFRPIDGPFGYAYEAIEHVEKWNCSRGHGCVHGAAPGDSDWTEFGPGGTCGLLATMSIGDQSIEEMDMDGGADHVTCWSYTPRPAPTPVINPPGGPIPEGQLMIGE